MIPRKDHAPRKTLSRANLGNVGNEVAQQVFDAVPQGRGRRGAARARALHGEVNHPVLETAEGDVAAVVRHRRAHPRLDQLLDGGDRLGVIFVEKFIDRGALPAGRHDRGTRHEVFHDGAEDRRLELLPVAAGLGHGDEIGPEEHAADSGNIEKALGEGGVRGLRAVAHVEGAVLQAGAAGKKLERFRIGRRLGLNEHGSCSVAGAGSKARAAHFDVLYVMVRGDGGKCGAGAHDRASRSSSPRCPGTIATGIGKLATVLPRFDTSGPGPSLPVPAASTRTAMSSSASIRFMISSAFSPSRTTRSGVMPAMPLARLANWSRMMLAASCASAFMMSATPSHC